LFVTVYSAEITLVLLGEAWKDAAPILMIVSFATFIRQAAGSTAFIMLSRGQSSTYLSLTVFHNVISVLCLCVGAPWGGKGLAFAELASTYIVLGPRLYYSLRESPVSVGMFFSVIARPAISSVVMLAVLHLQRLFFPTLSAPVSLAMGSIVALAVFPGVWLLMPGGKTELIALISDLRAAVQRKVNPIDSVERAAVAS
jgi:PST family polysaccharide transporter